MTDQYKVKLNLPSAFRIWLQEKWFEHKDELMLWEKRAPEYDDKYYFKKHKWMLRKMYREEQIEKFMEDNQRKIQKEIKRGFKKGNL
jgi:hypothetical protein